MAASLIRKLPAFFACLCGTLMLYWMVDVALTKPALAQRTDFCNSMFVAATLSRTGALQDLYPGLEATTEVGSHFSKIAHTLLPFLPPASMPVWQYPPLDAQFLTPFSILTPSGGLLAWQGLNLVALGVIAFVLSRTSQFSWKQCACFSTLLFPIFVTIKMGQQGLVLGLLPIFLGMHFIRTKNAFIGGMALSLTFLTMKFWVVAALIAVAFLKFEKRVFYGLCAGTSALLLLMFATTPLNVIAQWIHNLPLSEKYFFEEHFVHNLSLYVSLPALLILHFPIEYRQVGKVLFYGFSLMLTLASLFVQWKIAQTSMKPEQKLRIMFAASLYTMPIMLPHLLYYDLSGMALSGILLWNLSISESQLQKIRAIVITSAIAIDAYFINFAFFDSRLIHPLMFVLLLLVLFLQLMFSFGSIARQKSLNFAV